MKHKFPSRITSVTIAKHRLHTLLSSDRMSCSPELIVQMKEDIFHTISKYMEIEQKDFEVTFTRKDMYIRYTGEK